MTIDGIDDIDGVDGFDGMDMDMGIDMGCSAIRGEASGDTTGGDVARAGGSREGCVDSSTLVSSVVVASSSLAGAASAAGSEAFESMLVLPVSAPAVTARRAGLSGREPRSDEALDSDLSVPLLTALARRSCKRELGRLREGFRETCAVLAFCAPAAVSLCPDYPPVSTASFLSATTLSGFAAPSVPAGFAGVPSSASIVSRRDSRPEMAVFHQPFPLMLPVAPRVRVFAIGLVTGASLAFTVHSFSACDCS